MNTLWRCVGAVLIRIEFRRLVQGFPNGFSGLRIRVQCNYVPTPDNEALCPCVDRNLCHYLSAQRLPSLKHGPDH